MLFVRLETCGHFDTLTNILGQWNPDSFAFGKMSASGTLNPRPCHIWLQFFFYLLYTFSGYFHGRYLFNKYTVFIILFPSSNLLSPYLKLLTFKDLIIALTKLNSFYEWFYKTVFSINIFLFWKKNLHKIYVHNEVIIND